MFNLGLFLSTLMAVTMLATSAPTTTAMLQTNVMSTDMPQSTMIPTNMGSTSVPQTSMIPTNMGSTSVPQTSMIPTNMGSTSVPQTSMIPTNMGSTVMSSTTMSQLSSIDRLRNSFKELDKDGDGMATFAEFQALFNALDTDHNSKVTLAEYAIGANVDEKLVAPIFHLNDINKNGFLDERDVRAGYYSFDLDFDGLVSEQEFFIAYEKLLRRIINLTRPPTTIG